MRRIIQIAVVFSGVVSGVFGLARAAQTGGEAFQRGEQALRGGDLVVAEREFRTVLSKDPGSAGAHANLGVVYMRRKQWPQALDQLRAAEKLAPGVTGIRLNLGIAEFRRGDFGAAIPPLTSVLRDQPGSLQAAYLRGICFFLMERYPEAKADLAPLWDAESSNLQYLYALGIAAGNSGDHELEARSLTRLNAVGGGSAEMHLLAGKAHLTRQEDTAEEEFQAAIQADPKLPFAHYYLGVIKRKRGDLEGAKAEFLADAALAPDVPFDFEELGNIAATLGEKEKAEGYFNQALRIEPRLATARFSLGKIYRTESRFREALAQVDEASKSDDKSASLHYLRAQLLQKLNRKEEASREFAISADLRSKIRDDLEKKISGSGFREVGLEPSRP